MTKSKAAHIIRHSFKQLYKHAAKTKKGYDEDANHDFRVEYKRLRAFLRMLMLKAADPRHLKVPASFKEMYHTAGLIRDRQLCIKRIKADRLAGGGDLHKIHQLRKEIKDLSAKGVFLAKKDFDDMEAGMIKHLPAVLPGTSGEDFVGQKLIFINGMIDKKEYADKDLHDIRKGLKDIIYITAVYKAFKEETPAASLTEEDLKNAGTLAHELGLFNDAGIALSFLQPPEIRKAGAEEAKHLWAIRRRWLAEKRKLKKEVVAHIHEIKAVPASGA